VNRIYRQNEKALILKFYELADDLLKKDGNLASAIKSERGSWDKDRSKYARKERKEAIDQISALVSRSNGFFEEPWRLILKLMRSRKRRKVTRVRIGAKLLMRAFEDLWNIREKGVRVSAFECFQLEVGSIAEFDYNKYCFVTFSREEVRQWSCQGAQRSETLEVSNWPAFASFLSMKGVVPHGLYVGDVFMVEGAQPVYRD